MRKLLTAGIFGTILGIVGTGTVNASIVSSGFLDEKLTEYALSTSLDLKANQSDFTELNTQISNSIDNLKTLWNSEIGILADGFNPNKVNNDIEGAFGLVGGFIIHSMESLTRGWYESRDNFYQGIRQLNDGWTDSNDGTTYLGIKDLNTKIGTLPSGNFLEFPGSDLLFPGLKQPLTYPTSLAELITAIYGDSKTGGQGLLSGIVAGFPLDTDGDGIIDLHIGTLQNYRLAKDANDLANANATKIGKLPDDITVSEMLTSTWTTNGTTYPGLSLISDYIHRIELAYNTRFPSIFLDGGPSTTIDGVDYTGPVYPLWKLSEGIDKIDSIETKIGTLPSGVAPMLSGPLLENFNSHHIFPFDATYPQSLEELIIDLYGDTSAKHPGILGLLISESVDMVWAHEHEIFGGNNYTGLIDRTGAIERRIGTLPAGYDSVGAALTAIKGIAEDAKAAALAAIPDPKQEGSSGKFVLTVDIVGDNATYRWEKIDREGETTTE